jgi:hypothetical protein
VILHSETIHAFLRHAERVAKEILQNECGLTVGRTRFSVGRMQWPLNLACFEGDARWAYFESAFYQIRLNARLVGRVSDVALRDLLRHELAHYLVCIEGGDVTPHGPAFQAMCARFGWPTEVARASGDVFADAAVTDVPRDALIEKVKKLLALASSTNPHEAELATLKANQLILRHHLDRAGLADAAEESLCVLDVMRAARKSAKLVAVYDILTQFMVRPLLHFGRGEVRLQAIGNRSQVALAEYVAGYLDRELEVLWKATGLKGTRAKNSFFTGIAKGYRQKLEAARKGFSAPEKAALVKVEADLGEQIQRFMGGFGQTRTGQVLDGNALGQGVKAGSNLSIRPGVQTGGKVLRLS